MGIAGFAVAGKLGGTNLINSNHLVSLGVSDQTPRLIKNAKTNNTIGTESSTDNHAEKLAYLKSNQEHSAQQIKYATKRTNWP